ncbi:putative mRNA-decapping enzyme subunit 2 [Nannochloris sp. 'desiccata']|nr:putative mRNA-decapping enzyme subunit 2 [Chlorella desiccata (nom. nud.)]
MHYDVRVTMALEATQLPSPELLDDISVRFILTLPATELESFERLLFSVEQAWWHYEDHVRQRPENSHLRSLSLKQFTGLIFEKCPGLEPFRGSLEEIYASFNAYKRTVPVRGAILLDPSMEKCLLVRGFKKDAGWGFPRGKLSLNETDAQCAAREVIEETGFDITSKLVEDQYIDVQLGDQATRLFIIPGVEESTPFAPHVRGEIGAYGWHVVAHLPATWEEGKQLFVNTEGGRHKFFNVWPYMKPLRAWIKKAKRRGQPQQQQQVGAVVSSAVISPVAASGNVSNGAIDKNRKGPSESLRNFKFDTKDIVRHLPAPAPPTATASS